ncbi:MAG: FAD-dependent oxidoreductase [Kaiparowitsia implicata GSE-PSE-MK54-09C]|jgi:thiazole synthase|nr:FAD-dependent oxidoreductase [Kaiparowitsia implicata GSE-PSE-MK54-09C]
MPFTDDILIIGGGIVGLAIATELKLRGASVTVLSRDFEQAATHAAAGMLAPHAEAFASGAMQDICLRSRALYGDWVAKLEDLSGESAGYWPCGILAPTFAPVDENSDSSPPHLTNAPHQSPASSSFKSLDALQRSTPTPPNGAATSPAGALWLSAEAMHQAQSGLSHAITGGWWYPEDGQVDNRALAIALRAAARAAGVVIREGVAVTGLEQQSGAFNSGSSQKIACLKTSEGDWQADHYVLATGAWTSDLLPIPVTPRKGQMLSLTMPPGYAHGLPLQRVLFGDDVYIVPRRDGRIVIGATSEAVGFIPGNTPAGLGALLQATIRLCPGLAEFPIQERWWGFRPATPDELPILGSSLCDNLSLAVGHHRNGILLAPITAQLLADQVLGHSTVPSERESPEALLSAFSWRRFVHSPVPPAAAASIPQFLPSRSSSSTPSSTPTMLHYPTLVDAVQFTESSAPALPEDAPLTIAGRTFRSRLMTGTGKYPDFDTMRQSVSASGCEIVTVAVRRVQTKAPGHEGLAEALDWSKIWMLPNTAGCKTAEEAVRVARLGREMAKLLGQENNNFVKLEVIPDAKYLLPDPIGTLQAAEQLVKEGFAVLPYINADPLLAKRLEEAGCATVMPLGSPIGSGQGIQNEANIRIIVETSKVPVVVDAGIGSPSEAAHAMELGASALLINTAIAQAKNPVAMGRAMGLATVAGRLAYLAGRIPIQNMASASSPLTGTITS